MAANNKPASFRLTDRAQAVRTRAACAMLSDATAISKEVFNEQRKEGE